MDGIPPPGQFEFLGALPIALRAAIALAVSAGGFWFALQVIFPGGLARREHPAAALWSSIGIAALVAAGIIGFLLAREWDWLGLGVAILVGGLIAAGSMMYAATQN